MFWENSPNFGYQKTEKKQNLNSQQRVVISVSFSNQLCHFLDQTLLKILEDCLLV
jgi:hypothetical protein